MLSLESWSYSADEARCHIREQKAWSYLPATTWRLENKLSPVLLQLSSNFEICTLVSRSERESDWSLIGLANVGQESHDHSRHHGIIRFFVGITDPGPKASISHEFWYPTFLKTCPAMAGQAGLPSVALGGGWLAPREMWEVWLRFYTAANTAKHIMSHTLLGRRKSLNIHCC